MKYTMSFKDCDIMDVDDLTALLSNAEVDPNGPTGNVNRLTERLAGTSLGGDDTTQTDEGSVGSCAMDESDSGNFEYPPGTTIDEQLLILAGVEDYQLPHTHKPGDPSVNAANPQPVLPRPNAIRWHRYVPSRPDFTSAHHLSSLRHDVESKYGWMANAHLHELADAPLPNDFQELVALCICMSHALEDRWLKDGIPPVLPPKRHAAYPYWVPKHTINNVIYSVVKDENGRVERERWAKEENERIERERERESKPSGT